MIGLSVAGASSKTDISLNLIHCDPTHLWTEALGGRKLASIAGSRHAPRLDGLSFEETAEFERLDAPPPIDDNGKPAWVFEGEPTTFREKRWLELYTKQMQATRRGNSATQIDSKTVYARPAFTSKSK